VARELRQRAGVRADPVDRRHALPVHPLSPRRAPLLKIVPWFVLGLALGDRVRIEAPVLATVLALVWAGAVVLTLAGRMRPARLGETLGTLCLAASLILAGALRLSLAGSGREDVGTLADVSVPQTVAGRVVGVPKVRGDGVRFDLTEVVWRTPSGWMKAGGGLRAWARVDPGSVSEGDRVRLVGKVRRPDGRRNPGGFDYGAYLARRGIYGLISVYDPQGLEHLGRTWHGWLGRAVLGPTRDHCDSTLRRHLRGRPLGLARGLLLGERDRLAPDTIASLRDAGVLHVLTVSGLHVGLVVGIVLVLGRVLRFPPWARAAAALLACFFYAGVAGNRAPVVRASVMAAVGLGGMIAERDSPPVNMLALAALALLLARPGELWSAGFQLSFAAVFGIVAFFPILRDRVRCARRGLRSRLVDGLLVSLAAQLGVAPFVAYHFNQWTPVSLVANLVVLPLVALAIPTAALSILLSSVSDLAAAVPFAALWAVLKVLSMAAALLARVPFGSLVVKQPTTWMVAATYAGLVAGFSGLSARRWRITAASAVGLLLLAVLYVDPAAPRHLEVAVLDVGLGSAAVVHLPSGKSVLVDGGDRSPYRDYGAQVVVPYLRSRGIGRVDLVVLSHPHKDHFGGLGAVVRELGVGRVLDPGVRVDSRDYLEWLGSIEERGVPLEIVTRPWAMDLDSRTRLEVLPIDPGSRCWVLGAESERTNNASLVVRVAHGGVTTLIPGDIETCREIDLLMDPDGLDCDVLVVPHHGSAGSSTPEFVGATSPRVAVISVGKGGARHLPSREVIERYRAAGARVLRTDERGAVTIESDGRFLGTRWVVQTPRERRRDGAWWRALLGSGLVRLPGTL